jgi:hypothetical protein
LNILLAILQSYITIAVAYARLQGTAKVSYTEEGIHARAISAAAEHWTKRLQMQYT